MSTIPTKAGNRIKQGAFVEQNSLRPLKKISLGPFQVYICGKKSSDLYHLLLVMSQLEKTMTHHKNFLGKLRIHPVHSLYSII